VKAVISTVGSRGDVQPLLALSEGLRRAGHEVSFLAPPNFEKWVRALGFPFSAVGEDMESWLRSNVHHVSHHPVRIVRGMNAFLETQVHLHFEQLPKACRNADVVISSGLGFATPSVAESYGVPFVALVMQPVLLPSELHTPPFIPIQLPPLVNRGLWWVNEILFEMLLKEKINRGRKMLGLAPIRSVSQHLYERTILIAADLRLHPVTRNGPTTTDLWVFSI
jgi:UDP:flavonoid glycosyltransferase YjiC (YdhE family)